jgi:hypothetical protein
LKQAYCNKKIIALIPVRRASRYPLIKEEENCRTEFPLGSWSMSQLPGYL